MRRIWWRSCTSIATVWIFTCCIVRITGCYDGLLFLDKQTTDWKFAWAIVFNGWIASKISRMLEGHRLWTTEDSRPSKGIFECCVSDSQAFVGWFSSVRSIVVSKSAEPGIMIPSLQSKCSKYPADSDSLLRKVSNIAGPNCWFVFWPIWFLVERDSCVKGVDEFLLSPWKNMTLLRGQVVSLTHMLFDLSIFWLFC